MIVKCEVTCDSPCAAACSGVVYEKDRNSAIDEFKRRLKHCKAQQNLTVISSTDFTGENLLAASKDTLLKCPQTADYVVALQHAFDAAKIAFAQESKCDDTFLLATSLAFGCMVDGASEATLTILLNYLEKTGCLPK